MCDCIKQCNFFCTRGLKMGGSFSVPCIINPWCWWRKITRFFSDETFYLSCACASTAVIAGSCGLITYIILSCMTLGAASLISTGFRCHDTKSGKLLNTESQRIGQGKWAARMAILVIITGVLVQYLPVVGTPLMVMPDMMRRGIVTFIACFLIIGFQRVAEC